MIPLRDVIPSRTTPLVTVSLIVANSLVFAYELTLGRQVEEFTRIFGLVPADFSWVSVFTSMFLHGGLFHVGGNMLYLWIFGDNLEDAMGHGRYLVFYLLTGVLAGLAHVMVTAVLGSNPLVPCLGASGAISGILGGYIVLFPHRRVRVIWLYQVMEVPAIVALGVWFLFQLFSGAGSAGAPGGGVAYGAHIGGFLAGVVLVRLFARPRPAFQVA
jgi:membrane associated rhomboid family serine protease